MAEILMTSICISKYGLNLSVSLLENNLVPVWLGRLLNDLDVAAMNEF